MVKPMVKRYVLKNMDMVEDPGSYWVAPRYVLWSDYDDVERELESIEIALGAANEICDRQRTALRKIAAIEDQMIGGDWDEITEARTIANAVLTPETNSRNQADPAPSDAGLSAPAP